MLSHETKKIKKKKKRKQSKPHKTQSKKCTKHSTFYLVSKQNVFISHQTVRYLVTCASIPTPSVFFLVFVFAIYTAAVILISLYPAGACGCASLFNKL